MPDTKTPTTELTSQYLSQVTGDLERNAKEQERVNTEIETLRELLHALRHDHTVLVNMQQALGGGSAAGAEPAAVPAATAAPSLPRQISAEPKQRKARKTAPEKAIDKSSPAKDSKATAKPTLVSLIRGHLEQQSEPRSAAEICAALAHVHPERQIRTTVVRTTVEGLVAKGHVHRTKQGSSVFYTAVTGSESAAAEPQPEEAAG